MSDAIITKTCTKCNATKPLSSFYHQATRPDGHYPYCKTCTDAQVREYQASDAGQKKMREYRQSAAFKEKRRKIRNTPEYKAQMRAYRQSKKGREAAARYAKSGARAAVMARYFQNNRAACNARKLIWSRIASKKMPQASQCICSMCGNQADHYHHHNGYDKDHVLDIIPLCHSCHVAAHT